MTKDTMTAIVKKIAATPNWAPPENDELANDLRSSIVALWHQFQEAAQRNEKSYLQELHRAAKANTKEVEVHILQRLLKKHQRYFRDGALINPEKIRPKLVLVTPRTIWEDLFKISRGYWSIPYSKGYGRRLRFVIFDEAHDAVMGIIGLQSPPADLACRDELFSYPQGRKMEFINCTLDAYTIGAIPPYTHLLGGKLIASLVASEDIRRAYWRSYANKRTLIENKLLPQPLLAVTTTSAFGRSSIYNRLTFKNRVIAEPIGWTKGFGTVHLETIYPEIVRWLSQNGILVPNGFGNGPKVRWQNITYALQHLGLPAKYAEHGVKRQVFLFRHVSNLEGICSDNELPDLIKCGADELADYWLERWAIPRSRRDDSWRHSKPLPLISTGISELT